MVAQLMVGEGLEGDAAAVFALADEHRQAAQLVTGGEDAVGIQNKNGG